MQYKRKIPVVGSKDYNKRLKNWNIYKEVENLIVTQPELSQKNRYKIASEKLNMTLEAIKQRYQRTRLQIELSGKVITTDHSFDNDILEALSSTTEKIQTQRKAIIADATGKDNLSKLLIKKDEGTASKSQISPVRPPIVSILQL